MTTPQNLLAAIDRLAERVNKESVNNDVDLSIAIRNLAEAYAHAASFDRRAARAVRPTTKEN